MLKKEHTCPHSPATKEEALGRAAKEMVVAPKRFSALVWVAHKEKVGRAKFACSDQPWAIPHGHSDFPLAAIL
jgi:hypothetical protein